MAYTRQLQQRTKIYEQEAQPSHDDTFRGENFIQQSFRDGMLSNGGTMPSLNDHHQPLAARTDNPLHHQFQSLEPVHSTFEQQSSLTEQVAAQGHITHDFLTK